MSQENQQEQNKLTFVIYTQLRNVPLLLVVKHSLYVVKYAHMASLKNPSHIPHHKLECLI